MFRKLFESAVLLVCFPVIVYFEAVWFAIEDTVEIWRE